MFVTLFLYCFAESMVLPSVTDVTMAALCPGKDKCSLAIYLSGAQQVIVGLGSLVVKPMLGNLSDTYGRKIMLTIPITLSIVPLVVLACSMTKYYFYAYYVLKTLIAMATQGSVSFLAFAYVADIVQERKRASAFGIVSGIAFVSAVLGNFSARFLSTYSAFQYCLKAQFGFNKDQFADLLIISGIAGSISQLIILPVLSPLVGEAKMLSIGLFFTFAHILLYSVAWAPWVPYASAMMCIVSVLALPSLRSIASKLTGPDEQGKAQGCITGISSLAGIVAPFTFTPLTALFLADNPPFYFPGFSIFCSAIAAMVALILSMMIRLAPTRNCRINSSNHAQPLV